MTSTKNQVFDPLDPRPCPHASPLEVCGYSIFATRPVPVVQDRYPYPYPTRTQNYYPTRTRGYTRTRHCQAFLCVVHVPASLIGFQLGM